MADSSSDPHRCLVDLLLDRARHEGDRIAYEELDPGGGVTTMTYRELLARARIVAERAADQPGRDPVVLLWPPGLEFVAAMWGCLLAGVPAAPAYPPTPRPNDRAAERLRGMIADLRPARILCDPLFAGLLPAGAEDVETITFDGAADEPSLSGTPPAPGDVALLQYTSGSTGAPKGVVLRHSNLMHNTGVIASAFGLDRESRSITWLPPYHDMGLIGSILTPLRVGFPMRLMSPLHFLKSPLTWLNQISELGATATGGPDFAYDLCIRRAADESLPNLDLSTWSVAFNGAEPVRRSTMSAFAERFAGHGFRASSFYPCYGLAEATLIVTGAHWDPNDTAQRTSCGPALTDTDVAVVDPHTGAPCSEGTEGEIWVQGPGVCAGYHNADPDTHPFATIDGAHYLRTGDLGILEAGELTVTGRIKDVLIHRGENHHPHDVEDAAVDGNSDVRPTAAAFMLEEPAGVALAVERRPSGVANDPAVALRLRSRVLERTGLRLEAVVLCAPRAIPRTTSGKVRRSEVRDLVASGALEGASLFHDGPTMDPADVTENSEVSEHLARFLAGVYSGVCEIDSCNPDHRLVDIGGDSLRAGQIASVVEETMSLPVPLEAVLANDSPRALAHDLLERWRPELDPAAIGRRLNQLTESENRAQ